MASSKGNRAESFPARRREKLMRGGVLSVMSCWKGHPVATGALSEAIWTMPVPPQRRHWARPVAKLACLEIPAAENRKPSEWLHRIQLGSVMQQSEALLGLLYARVRVFIPNPERGGALPMAHSSWQGNADARYHLSLRWNTNWNTEDPHKILGTTASPQCPGGMCFHTASKSSNAMKPGGCPGRIPYRLRFLAARRASRMPRRLGSIGHYANEKDSGRKREKEAVRWIRQPLTAFPVVPSLSPRWPGRRVAGATRRSASDLASASQAIR